MQRTWWHGKMGAPTLIAVALALIAGFIFGMSSAGGASARDQTRAAASGIPRGYTQVDPRDPARSLQVFLGQPLSDNAPIFPGDPKFKWQLWNCVNAHPSVPRCQHGSGYTLEQIQSLAPTPARTSQLRATSTRTNHALTACPRNSSGCAR